MSFGKELQLERQRRRITLESIAEGTKVPTRHLRALEQEEYAQLPGGVFNKGIVRSYCRYLGLDEQEWLGRTPSSFTLESEPDWASFAENVRRSRANRRSRTGAQWLGVLVMLMALVVLGWAAWKFVLQPRMVVVPQAGQLTLPGTFLSAQEFSNRATPPGNKEERTVYRANIALNPFVVSLSP